MLCANEARRGAEGEKGRQEGRFRSDEIQYTLTEEDPLPFGKSHTFDRILFPIEYFH